MAELKDFDPTFTRPVQLSRQVVLSAEDYGRLVHRVVHELLEQAKKPYGIKLVRKEDGTQIDSRAELLGALHDPLRRALGWPTGAQDGDDGSVVLGGFKAYTMSPAQEQYSLSTGECPRPACQPAEGKVIGMQELQRTGSKRWLLCKQCNSVSLVQEQ